ncbi:MAG: class I SAM-dependent methyltransferase [Thermoguttaceae bacterium]|nr:class I SAM-dependent methyltransferase [Thermoguttaceae bacterium]
MLGKLKRQLNLILGRDYCPFCSVFTKFKPFGKEQRPHAECPFCGSLERHRFLLSVYKDKILTAKTPLRILHTAPETIFAKLFQKESQIVYTPIDLYPELFPDIPCVKADVTDLPFENESFDVILSNHVLEHIPNYEKCCREFQRVLAPDGRAFLTFPVDWNRAETLEDSAIQTPQDRLKFYGQADHVRLFGCDSEELLAKFFRVTKLTQKDYKPFGNQQWNDAAYCFLLEHKT